MAKKKEEKEKKRAKGGFDIGGFFKGFLSKKKTPDKKSPEPAGGKESQAAPEEPEDTEVTRKPARPATTKSISVSAEERVFQSIVVTGPQSGALRNMRQILLRRGYDVHYVPLITKRRGGFEKFFFDAPFPEGFEVMVLFEPESVDQAVFALNDVKKRFDVPAVVIARQVVTPKWQEEVVREFGLSGRYLVRFTFSGLLRIFQRIGPPATQAATNPPVPPAAAVEPEPGLEVVEHPPEGVPPEGQPQLVEVEEERPFANIEEKTEVLSEDTIRPLAELAAVAREPYVHYKIIGREDEGIDPGRILTRREFERLFHARFQEHWKITLEQSPRATPPILVTLERIEASAAQAEEESQEEPVSEIQQAEKELAGAPQKAHAQVNLKPEDLKESIGEVRKWWQAGRMTKLHGELELIRLAVPDLDQMNREAFLKRFVPIVEGTTLFAKGRLDRTVESTLAELWTEYISRHGLRAALRLMAMMKRGRAEGFEEVIDSTGQIVSGVMSQLLPEEENRQTFDEMIPHISEHLTDLDELVEKTIQIEKLSGPGIYEYFEKLNRITQGLHEHMVEIDPSLLIFGRLDKVIVGSQTRSDWAFDHAQESGEWQDRLRKFLYYLAEIRIETCRIRREIEMLVLMADQGIESAIEFMSERPVVETPTGEKLKRVDDQHLREPRNQTLWHIHLHRANYLVDLLFEDDPNIRAFATFNEEEITFSWVGIYQATAEQIQEHVDAFSSKVDRNIEEDTSGENPEEERES
jgi:hypothetical protein